MFHASRIAIAGTGLLGASLGLALKRRGFTGSIAGLGRRAATVDSARRIGALDEATVDPAEALAGAELVVIAVPLGKFESVMSQVAEHADAGAIVTDVGSAKLGPIAQARRILPDPARFVGAHPMAGNEQAGPDAADAELYDGKPCILTAEDDTDPAAAERVADMWRSVGMKITNMSAAEHDRQTALVSHLPHAVAVLLVRVAAEHGGWDVASTGFASTTRLASSNPPMRADIMLANRGPLLGAIERLERELDGLRGLLDGNDEAGLVGLLNDCRTTREDWLARCGVRP